MACYSKRVQLYIVPAIRYNRHAIRSKIIKPLSSTSGHYRVVVVIQHMECYIAITVNWYSMCTVDKSKMLDILNISDYI